MKLSRLNNKLFEGKHQPISLEIFEKSFNFQMKGIFRKYHMDPYICTGIGIDHGLLKIESFGCCDNFEIDNEFESIQKYQEQMINEIKQKSKEFGKRRGWLLHSCHIGKRNRKENITLRDKRYVWNLFIEFNPANTTKEKFEKYLYIMVSSQKVPNILRRGLIPEMSPMNKTFLWKTKELAEEYIYVMALHNYYKDTKEATMLKIDTKKLKNINFQTDTEFGETNNGSIWTYSFIPPQAISAESTTVL